MTDAEQEIDRLRRRLGWEAGGPLAQVSTQATDTHLPTVTMFLIATRMRCSDLGFRMLEAVKQITRPAITSSAVLVDARHEAGPMRRTAINGQKHH